MIILDNRYEVFEWYPIRLLIVQEMLEQSLDFYIFHGCTFCYLFNIFLELPITYLSIFIRID